MTTLRVLYVLRIARAMRADSGESRVLVSRRFGTVETRARRDHGPQHVPLPADDSALCQEFSEAISAAPSSLERVPLRCACALRSGLWPVCWATQPTQQQQQQDSVIYFVAVPLVPRAALEARGQQQQQALGCVSATFGVLDGIMGLCAPFHPRYDAAAVAEIQSLLTLALPFGKPQLTAPDAVRMAARQGFPSEAPQTRVPGWRPLWPRPGSLRGGGRVELTVEETVDAVQYDNPSVPDTWTVSGAVHARMELEGVPEVTLFVAAADDSVQRFRAHACAQLASDTLTADGVRCTLTPPPAPFVLATYAVQRPPRLPVRGFYQMREDGPTRAKLLLQLKLDASVNNAFAHFEVVLPFRNRGHVSAVQATPSTGSVAVSHTDPAALVWTIGQRVSAANLEVALAALVSFDAAAVPDSSDPFCAGPNCFAQVRFRVQRWAPSALGIDPKKIAVFPVGKTKPTIVVDRCCVSGEYLIWNSLGKARIAKPLQQVHPTSS